MQQRELTVAGAFELSPAVHGDDRGRFYEWYRADVLEGLTGGGFARHSSVIAQANVSLSKVGTLRGIHFAQVPPGQAKYVTCLAGAVLDVVVDLRLDSPTFSAWDGVLLDAREPHCVYLPEGLGHAFVALADDSLVTYLCSTPYTPSREHTVTPFDPTIGVEWPELDLLGRPMEYLLSERDRSAPTLEEARAQGLLSVTPS